MVCLASVLSIGSVVAVRGRRFVVVGHRVTRDGGHAGLGYLVVPYPFGFVDGDSLSLMPATGVERVVRPGYRNELGDAYLAELDAIAERNAAIPYDDYADAVLAWRTYLDKEEDHV